METAAITAWTFQAEVAVPQDVAQLLVSNERAVAAYQTFRDVAIFTTRRVIVRDAQGMTGWVEVYSLPYSSINMWSSENEGGTLDFKSLQRAGLALDAEIELWTRAGHIKIKLGRGVDVRRLDNLIAHAVLGALE